MSEQPVPATKPDDQPIEAGEVGELKDLSFHEAQHQAETARSLAMWLVVLLVAGLGVHYLLVCILAFAGNWAPAAADSRQGAVRQQNSPQHDRAASGSDLPERPRRAPSATHSQFPNGSVLLGQTAEHPPLGLSGNSAALPRSPHQPCAALRPCQYCVTQAKP